MNLFRGIEIIQINIINQVLQPQKQSKTSKYVWEKLSYLNLITCCKEKLVRNTMEYSIKHKLSILTRLSNTQKSNMFKKVKYTKSSIYRHIKWLWV